MVVSIPFVDMTVIQFFLGRIAQGNHFYMKVQDCACQRMIEV